MIVVLTLFLFLLGGTDGQSYTCRSCGDFGNLTVPGGDQPTVGFFNVSTVRDANDCKIAVFQCVVLNPKCIATSYVVDASGNRLMNYPPSSTISDGGSMTCTVLSTGAGWRFNRGWAEFRCNFTCTGEDEGGSDDGMPNVDLTFPTEKTTLSTVTTVEPTTTTDDGRTKTCGSCSPFLNRTVPGGDQPTNGFYIVDMVRDANDCDVAVFKCVVFDPRCVATSYVNDASGNRLMTYPANNKTSEGGNMTCTVLSSGAGWRYNGVPAEFGCDFKCDITTTVEPTTTVTTVEPTTGQTCKICSGSTNRTIPGGDRPTNGYYIASYGSDENGCNAFFQCVVVNSNCTATLNVLGSNGKQLMTYPPSNTVSQGGNMTCSGAADSAGWLFNGEWAQVTCDFDCGDTTTTVQPTTPTTTTTTVKPTTTSVKPTTTAVASTTVQPTTDDDVCYCDCEEGSDGGGYY
ncbi:hypothetical protein B9Z55_021726 [Caenorhabditis nigoni]|uniref:C6 domain-containing protein n=1 Tax=Caenorhabditis nigoni TaxID=1611254 RepID=A0A2G5TTD3_9PELO|nr:hypothetical protein B9Z55_021726 [Caenorhabditis nigoni]